MEHCNMQQHFWQFSMISLGYTQIFVADRNSEFRKNATIVQQIRILLHDCSILTRISDFFPPCVSRL